jgi:type II secretory pathway component PulK
MSAHHPLRRLLTALLVLATLATATAGMLLRTHVVGIALIAAGALCATGAWYALGTPVRRRDIARDDGDACLPGG